MSPLPGAAAPCARACRLARRGLACGRTAAARGSACLAGERGPRGCRTRFPFECLAGRATAARRRFLARCGAAAGAIAGGAFACASRSAARLGRGQRDARASGLGKANGDRLLGRACTVFALSHVLDFLAYELTRLGAGCFALGLVFGGSSLGSFFRHLFSSLEHLRCRRRANLMQTASAAPCRSLPARRAHAPRAPRPMGSAWRSVFSVSPRRPRRPVVPTVNCRGG